MNPHKVIELDAFVRQSLEKALSLLVQEAGRLMDDDTRRGILVLPAIGTNGAYAAWEQWTPRVGMDPDDSQ